MRKEKRQFLCKYSIFFAGLSRSSTYLCRYTYLHTSTNTVGCIPHTTIFACFLPTTHANTTVGRYPIPTFLYSKFSVPLFVPLISFNFVLLFSLSAILSFFQLSFFICVSSYYLSFFQSFMHTLNSLSLRVPSCVFNPIVALFIWRSNFAFDLSKISSDSRFDALTKNKRGRANNWKIRRVFPSSWEDHSANNS